MKRSHTTFRPVLKLSVVAVALMCAHGAHAFQFKLDNGLTGSFDTTISYGISVRAQGQDQSLIGIANGGTSRSVNEDDGDRAYNNNKAFASVLKATHDLELKYQNFGAFVRGTYFYDFENHDRSNLGPEGRKRVGRDGRILDAFVSGNFDIADHGLRLRAGNQVISWGESTFIPNGINVINSVDLSKLRVPGSELKEGFIPTTSLWGSLEITKAASVEGFILGNHDKIKLDPRGSYFSNNDFASDDAWKVFVGFGRRKDLTNPATNPILFPAAALANPTIAALNNGLTALYGPADPAAAVWAPRISDRSPSDSGQYGVAFRYLAPELNNTEFGFYHMNYHSRIPLFSGIKGKATSIITGGPLTTTLCSAALVAAIGSSACDQARTDIKAAYFAEYPEDIKLYGFSFNTAGPFGTALQGEWSYRSNQPLQIATPELLLAALGAPNLLTGYTQIPGAPAGASAAALVPDGTEITGWKRVKMSQLQATVTKSFPNILGAEQGVMVGEIGYTKYHNLPTNLKFNGPGVFLPATPLGAIASAANSVQETGFVTTNSYGYRLVGRLDYSDVILGANFSPRFAFNHDVKGVSQTFNEGAKSFSVGGLFDYQKKLTVDLAYTQYFGGRTYCGTDVPASTQSTAGGQPTSYCSSANPLKDRDFYSIAISYSF